MRALVQRVIEAKVTVDELTVGAIGKGLLILLGVGRDDKAEDAAYLSRKVVSMRLFDDADGRMNRSVVDIGGELLIVSQFTLYGDVRKGNRPSYSAAASPGHAQELYNMFVGACRSTGLVTATGTFRAHMRIHLINDGPVTILCDSDASVRPIE